MLKIKGIRDEETDGGESGSGAGGGWIFEIAVDGSPASEAEVALVARFASQLLRENDLAGEFRSAGDGLLELRLGASERTFFHDGIVFAALDAVNDPVKNPTLTRFAPELPDAES
jgi:hypothetical protein